MGHLQLAIYNKSSKSCNLGSYRELYSGVQSGEAKYYHVTITSTYSGEKWCVSQVNLTSWKRFL